MKKLRALVLMQIRDKLDFSWTATTKSKIQKIVLSLIKFILITVAVIFILKIIQLFGVFYYSQVVDVMIIFVSVLVVLSIISCTLGLMRNLYFADDNKVLVTLPLPSNTLFLSKIIIFYLYELKKSLDLLVPCILGFMISAFTNGQVTIAVFFWMWIPILLIVLLPVLIASFLSIPAMYINMLFKKFPIVEIIALIIAIGLAIFGVVYLINLIPENIDLIHQWPAIKQSINNFLMGWKEKTGILCYLVYVMTGSYEPAKLMYIIDWKTVLALVILIAIAAILVVLAYLIIKPLFFRMLTKSFEFDKNIIDTEKENKVHKPFITFVNKEFRINIRDVEFSGSYLAVYIIVPILILLLNSLFAAMNTKLSGDIMTYGFNMLLILLPLLASNSMIATLYSKEGRAGYIKKTKPINPITPLFSKLLFNLIFSIPTIVITVFIFASFSKIGAGVSILLAIAILLIQYGHIFYSATLDIMNPQNEQYATVGEEISNPNENKSTLVAFIMSIVIALISYGLFTESHLSTGSFVLAAVKILLIGIAIFASELTMFLLKVKAYYYEK